MARPDTNNEVIDLSQPKEWLYKCDCPKCLSGMHYDKEIADSYRKRGKLINEVARLREFLNRAIQMLTAVTWGDEGRDFDWKKVMKDLEKLAKETALAPATEETKTSAHPDKCIGNVAKFTHEGNADAKFKQCEWRELGLLEVIQEGDETMAWGSQEWFTPCGDYYLGRPVYAFRPNRFRTRRPLPTTNCKQFSSKLVVEPKQEKTPPRLAAEIEVIDTPSTYSVTEARHATSDAIRYLRDEIQKLKGEK
jgi:hypothetical protein